MPKSAKSNRRPKLTCEGAWRAPAVHSGLSKRFDWVRPNESVERKPEAIRTSGRCRSVLKRLSLGYFFGRPFQAPSELSMLPKRMSLCSDAINGVTGENPSRFQTAPKRCLSDSEHLVWPRVSGKRA